MTVCLPFLPLGVGGFLCQAHALSVMKLKKQLPICFCFVHLAKLLGMTPH